jgi:hypothetical protein
VAVAGRILNLIIIVASLSLHLFATRQRMFFKVSEGPSPIRSGAWAVKGIFDQKCMAPHFTMPIWSAAVAGEGQKCPGLVTVCCESRHMQLAQRPGGSLQRQSPTPPVAMVRLSRKMSSTFRGQSEVAYEHDCRWFTQYIHNQSHIYLHRNKQKSTRNGDPAALIAPCPATPFRLRKHTPHKGPVAFRYSKPRGD